MELNDLTEKLDEMRGDEEEATEAVTILMVKLGQMAEGKLRLDAAEDAPQDALDKARRDLLAGTMIACAEYACEHDLDLDEAVSERVEAMEEMKRQRDEVKEAMESGDARALAEALGADAQEVPTGTDDDPRGYQ